MRTLQRQLLLLAGLALTWGAMAARVSIALRAPAYAGERVRLYRYLDLLTLRTEVLADATVDANGNATLQADVSGTVKATLRIGTLNGDLWLRGGHYTIGFPAADPRKPRSVNGTTEVDLTFTDVDRLDVNALLADLNMRLDDFIAQDLATVNAAPSSDFSMEIGGVVFSNEEHAVKALNRALTGMPRSSGPVELGSYRGLMLCAASSDVTRSTAGSFDGRPQGASAPRSTAREARRSRSIAGS